MSAAHASPEAPAGAGTRLRLLSYNIHAGVHATSYRHYITRGWHHLLPRFNRLEHLDRIAAVIADYDLVALQEIDGVGAAKRKALLSHFGGVKGVQAASVEDIARVPGISRALAERIFATLH